LELLRALTALQHEHGYLDEARLREFAEQRQIPLYRVQGLVSFYPHFRQTPPPRARVDVCRDLGCWMAGSDKLTAEMRQRFTGSQDVEIHESSCLGRCDAAPAVVINDVPLPREITADVERLVALALHPEQLPANRPTARPRQWQCDPYAGPAEHYGTVRELIASGADLKQVCLERLKESKLRGMGGAGFPTGMKWGLVAQEAATPKYVVLNADESEPGTFKDRVILEELPHLVIEGMLLAALCVGAEQGIVYLRHEYAREQQALEAALGRARASGILGENAAGSGRRFEIEIFVSPGGYILGEETALLEALEDQRGEPRNKPPYPGTHGLWGRPTLINNVETFALATAIISRGAAWWRSQGDRHFHGLKFISVSGDVERPGVYEIPLGLSIRALIELAGGMKDGKPLKAILPGGASSNFLTADHADTALDFEELQSVGSMLGSGAVVAIAEGTDLFALATNVVRFFRNESCGKCVPCRVGSTRAVELLQGVQAGEVSPAELGLLPELGETLHQTSICGLGQVALNPILSMMKNFPQDVPRDD
jgi:formate dehydrogenase/NADH-quinone oxidoreductase subunit F